MDPSHVAVFIQPSQSLSPSSLDRAGVLPARFISIDGGHDEPTVHRDLLLAESVLAEGGIVALDDFNNDHWMGVREGFYSYMFSREPGTRLAPFLHAANKLYLTSERHHSALLEAVLNDLAMIRMGLKVLPNEDGFVGDSRIAGWQVAIASKRWDMYGNQRAVLLLGWDSITYAEESEKSVRGLPTPLAFPWNVYQQYLKLYYIVINIYIYHIVLYHHIIYLYIHTYHII